jgi:hypothetical protein
MGWLLDSFGNIWRKTVPIRSWLDGIWKSPGMGVVLLLGSWAVAIYWLFSTPSPGKSVGALAVVATVMTFRGELSGLEKTFLTLVLFLFVFIEIKAIDKDRADSNAQALRDRNAQDLAFQSVRDAQDADFRVTAGGLQTAIGGIRSTLITANTTLLQTQPHATLRLDSYEFYPSVPSELKPNIDYQINYHYINSGTATATDTKKMAALYVADADDKDAQLKLVQRFNADWETESVRGGALVPGTPFFGSLYRTFTDDEMKNLNPKKTLYLLVRFEYSDETGRWRTESCRAYQREASTEINLRVAHTCSAFENSRSPVKRLR